VRNRWYLARKCEVGIDGNGNLLSDGTTTNTWDARDRLVSGGNGYDTGNLRTKMGAQKILLDGIEEAREYGGNVMRYDHDPSRVDGLLAQKAGGVKGYFITDALGSVYAVVDSTGTEVSKYSYDVYGARTATSEGMATSWGFTGRIVDGTGDAYLRDRYLNVATGGFIARDVLSSGPDPLPGRVLLPSPPYGYALDNPTILRDPLGLFVGSDHSALTLEALLASGVGGIIPARAAWANTWVDIAQLSDFKHGMRATTDGPILSALYLGMFAAGACQPPVGLEDADVAIDRARQWIDDNLEEMSQKMCTKDKVGAAEAFGRALHTIQDQVAHLVMDRSPRVPASIWDHCRLGLDSPNDPDQEVRMDRAFRQTYGYVGLFRAVAIEKGMSFQ
jgi:RHS repeat-associated protein